jgi:uncharacterized membrane protein YbhN (UPF0104 family)
MTQKEILKWGILGAIAEIIYIVLIAAVLFNMGNVLPAPPAILGIALFLIIFVFSAAVSGLFVLGYPFYLFAQKKIKEAILTFLITLSTLLIISVFAIIVLYLINN